MRCSVWSVARIVTGTSYKSDFYLQASKKFQSFFEKPLDKYRKVWYNISVKGEGQPSAG